MAKKKRASKKRQPSKQRLVMPKGRRAAVAKVLKPKVVAQLKADFDAAHADGMEALKRHDYDAVGDAIAREGDVIDAISGPIEPGKRRK